MFERSLSTFEELEKSINKRNAEFAITRERLELANARVKLEQAKNEQLRRELSDAKEEIKTLKGGK